MRRTVAALAFLPLAVAACGGGGSDQVVAEPTGQAESSSTEDSQPTEEAAGTTVSVPPSCEDPSGDSTGALDLTAVTVARDGIEDTLTFIFNYEGAVPSSGSVLFSALGGTKQYGYKVVDGEPSSHFVFDFSESQQKNVEDQAAEVGPTEASFTFDAEDVEVDKLTGATATISVEGDDVDECALTG